MNTIHKYIKLIYSCHDGEYCGTKSILRDDKTISSGWRHNLRVFLPDGLREYGDVVQATHRCVLERPHHIRENDCSNIMNNLSTRKYRRVRYRYCKNTREFDICIWNRKTLIAFTRSSLIFSRPILNRSSINKYFRFSRGI